jgi:hypothetical protein
MIDIDRRDRLFAYVYSLGTSSLNVTGFFPWLFSQRK